PSRDSMACLMASLFTVSSAVSILVLLRLEKKQRRRAGWRRCVQVPTGSGHGWESGSKEGSSLRPKAPFCVWPDRAIAAVSNGLPSGRGRRCGGATRQLQFQEDVGDVALDRMFAQVKSPRDGGIAQPGTDEIQYLAFARGQDLYWRAGRMFFLRFQVLLRGNAVKPQRRATRMRQNTRSEERRVGEERSTRGR